MDVSQRNKSRRSFVMVLIAFGLPIILAKLALTFNWLDYGVTNKGELLETPFLASDLGVEVNTENKQWLLLYFLPQQCDALCQQVMIGVNNTYVALGKEMPRVTPVGLYQQSIPVIPDEQLTQIRQHEWLFTDTTSASMPDVQQGHLYIADPLGNVFMKHALPQSQQEIASFGKSVLADMKKVLKYSKVG